MLRIVLASENPNEVVLKIAGRLGGDFIGLLSEERRRHQRPDLQFALDLDELRAIDPEGMDLLRDWARQGVQLRGGSQFIRLLLKGNDVL